MILSTRSRRSHYIMKFSLTVELLQKPVSNKVLIETRDNIRRVEKPQVWYRNN
jgi:hypothetical protein